MNLLETLNYYNLDHKKTAISGCPFGTNKEMCGYISMYYKDLFDELKFKELNIIEIGSWLGGSLLLWEKFFINSTIIGIDPNPQHSNFLPIEGLDVYKPSSVTFEEYLTGNTRIKFFKEDAYNKKFIDENFQNDSIDILLDDGPHTLHFQKLLVDVYFNKVKRGGLIIIEDIIEDDINELLNYYKVTCTNSIIELSFNKSPWNSKLYNIITIKKL